MILGIGTDAVEVARIEAAVARHGIRFAQRILGPRELLVHSARAARSPLRGTLFLATRFAAKEAISKALGLGMHEPMYWRSAQIVNAASGRPEVVTSGALAEYLRERRIRLHVSISDLNSLALAYAIAETVTEAEAS
ncbi:MAG TPA: holo-ACP synthase [Burkholderiaceae bacterium]|nr:holo-ACP synthase [Burkholderiaceae bacterium]